MLCRGGAHPSPIGIGRSDPISKIGLHYAVWSADHAAYAEELVGRYGHRVLIYVSEQGERIALAKLLDAQQLGTHLYVCGPAAMIDWALSLARDLGWPEPHLHHERFAAPATGEPYSVRLAGSNLDLRVGAHQSMLEAIEAAGVEAPSLCRGGACGQCETRVLHCDGTLLHSDHCLTEAEKASAQKVMPCVSRFVGTALVLDL